MGNLRYSAFGRFAIKIQQKLKKFRARSSQDRSLSVSSSSSFFEENLIFFNHSSPFRSCQTSQTKGFFARRLSQLLSFKRRQGLRKLELTNFLKIYFDFAYCLCLCPFRLDNKFSDFSSGYGHEYIVKSWWPQKLACAVASFLSLLWFIRDLRLSAPKDPKNPSLHFRLLLKVLGFLMKFTTIKRFWMNQEEFRNILNYIAIDANSLPVQPIRILNQHFVRFLCVLYTGMGITNWICGLGLGSYSDSVSTDDHISNWSGTWWWTSMVNASNYYNLFREPLEKNATVSYLDTVLAIPGAIGFLQM